MYVRGSLHLQVACDSELLLVGLGDCSPEGEESRC